MPDVTPQETAVTNYVYDRFGGDTYSSYTDSISGANYYTFGSAIYERWVDVDNDGYFDYGKWDQGYGEWWTYDGTGQWKNSSGDDMETLNPRAGPAGLMVEEFAGTADKAAAENAASGGGSSDFGPDNSPGHFDIAHENAALGISNGASEWVL